MEQGDVEGLGRQIRERAGLAEDEIVPSPLIVVRILGQSSLRRVEWLKSNAVISRVNGEYRIYVRARLPDVNFIVAHELAHWGLRELAGYDGNDEEYEANRVAATIVAPPRAVQAAIETHGTRLSALGRIADIFTISQTSAHLRIAEVTGEERAVVTKSGNVLVRSRGGYAWGPEVVDVARGLVKNPALTKAKLTGGIDVGRWAIRAKTRKAEG